MGWIQDTVGPFATPGCIASLGFSTMFTPQLPSSLLSPPEIYRHNAAALLLAYHLLLSSLHHPEVCDQTKHPHSQSSISSNPKVQTWVWCPGFPINCHIRPFSATPKYRATLRSFSIRWCQLGRVPSILGGEVPQLLVLGDTEQSPLISWGTIIPLWHSLLHEGRQCGRFSRGTLIIFYLTRTTCMWDTIQIMDHEVGTHQAH